MLLLPAEGGTSMSDTQMLMVFNARVQAHVRTKLQLWALASGDMATLRRNVPPSLQSFIIPHLRDDRDLTDAEMQTLAEWGQQEVLAEMKAENAERRSSIPAHMTRQDPVPPLSTIATSVRESDKRDMTWWWIGGGVALVVLLIIIL